MKQIVTHKSPDPDAIASVWLIKRFLPGWEDSQVQFVSAGNKLEGSYERKDEVVEVVDGQQTLHVDTGLGKLDHHQTSDDKVSAASLTFDYIKSTYKDKKALESNKFKAVDRIVTLVVENDHFKEIFRPDAQALYQDFSLSGIVDGLRLEFADDNMKVIEHGALCFDALLHTFENRLWAEEEIKEKGIPFKTKWGIALAIETINDDVLKIGQLMGYKVVVKKDPNHGFVRIKTLPETGDEKDSADLTIVYEKLKELDPQATWFLHVSKKMLLNGSSKNPDSKPSILPLLTIKETIESL